MEACLGLGNLQAERFFTQIVKDFPNRELRSDIATHEAGSSQRPTRLFSSLPHPIFHSRCLDHVLSLIPAPATPDEKAAAMPNSI
jgi:hypothetical protein